MKRLLPMLLALLMLTACGQTQEVEAPSVTTQTQEVEILETPELEVPACDPADFNIGALIGPTAMGLVELMDTVDSGAETANNYTFTLSGSASELTPLLIKGELDMVCLPANAAAALYPKMEQDLQVLAVNTLGVLYITELGDTISSMADLAGQTIVAAGQGGTPEYSLQYLLAENGLEMGVDVIVEWKSEHAECVAALASGAATIALLPQPFVTAAQVQLPDLRVAVDMNQAWDELDTDSGLITGVIVAKRSTVEENPQAILNFLEEYAASVDFVNANTQEAAVLIEHYGIVSATVAEQALPQCNIVCLTGADMAVQLSGYLQVLAQADLTSVGGSVPDESFYFQG